MIASDLNLRGVAILASGLVLLNWATSPGAAPGAERAPADEPKTIHLAAEQIICWPGDVEGSLEQIRGRGSLPSGAQLDHRPLRPDCGPAAGRVCHRLPAAADDPRTGCCAAATDCTEVDARESKLPDKVLTVPRTEDFDVHGQGDSPAWERARWEPLQVRSIGGNTYQTRVKLLYSATGLYVLMEATDQKITATITEDFLDLWKEDVFEFFLWPDERHPIYFEYEISPLGFELPILIPNRDGQFLGWRPWHYDGPRKTRKATTVAGGPKQAGAEVTGWKAEVFVPYELLAPLGNVPPKPGTCWRANFYRIDYDGGRATSWDWARVGPSFHEFRKFGTLVFD